MKKIAVIGAGNMGGAVARGLAESGEYEVRVSNPSTAKLEALQRDYPSVQTYTSNEDCARGADVIVLAIKPWKIEGVIAEIRPLWEQKNIAAETMASSGGCTQCGWAGTGVTLISLAAGIDLAALRSMVGVFPSVYRAIPNTAVSVGCGVTFISTDGNDEELNEDICDLFSLMGSVELVEERCLDAGMAVASCGMAFMMRMLRAMTEGGVELGLTPAVALRAAASTMRGAAELIEQGGLHPEQEVDKVTTPGGITIRGLNAMEEGGFTASVVKGLRACCPR